jgi:hypothetical protein
MTLYLCHLTLCNTLPLFPAILVIITAILSLQFRHCILPFGNLVNVFLCRVEVCLCEMGLRYPYQKPHKHCSKMYPLRSHHLMHLLTRTAMNKSHHRYTQQAGIRSCDIYDLFRYFLHEVGIYVAIDDLGVSEIWEINIHEGFIPILLEDEFLFDLDVLSLLLFGWWHCLNLLILWCNGNPVQDLHVYLIAKSLASIPCFSARSNAPRQCPHSPLETQLHPSNSPTRHVTPALC